MKKIFALLISLFLIFFFILYFKSINVKGTNKNYFMTIMYSSINGNTYYYKYDLDNKTYKTIYYTLTNGYSDGIVSEDGNNFYYTYKDSQGKYNLYKKTVNDNSYYSEQLTKNIKIDELSLGDNKIFCRAEQYGHRNNTIAIFDLLNNKLNICETKDTDSTIFNLQYNQFTHKIYTIERSLNEIDTTHAPNIPAHRIVEYDQNGNKIKELFKMNGFIDNISVSKDGTSALFSVSVDPSLDKIYLINFSSSNKKLILESTTNYVVSKPIFSSDEKGFYFTAITPTSKVLYDNGNTIERSKGIYYYDFSTKKTSKIFYENNGVVNDFNIHY